MPQPKPAAEIEIELSTVRNLLREQHPDLASLPLQMVDAGWDNVVVRVGDDLLARLPRREAAVTLIGQEQRWLPILAPRLPLKIPAPLRNGRPGAGYPWPWSITPFFPGDNAARTPPNDPMQAAERLGSFLAALHRPAPPDAPENPFRGVPLAHRADALARNLAVARDAGLAGVGSEFDTVWTAALAAAPWAGVPLWLHGDLHPANVLVHRGLVSAVIDFGDLTSGDPAVDLAVPWLMLEPAAHERFWSTYAAAAEHPMTAALIDRARGWAARLGLAISVFSAGDPLMTEIGRRALAAVADVPSDGPDHLGSRP